LQVQGDKNSVKGVRNRSEAEMMSVGLQLEKCLK